MSKILLIDHFDSFTFNVVNLLKNAGKKASAGGVEPVVRVLRVDEASLVSDVEKFEPDLIVLSPGPGTPADYPVCREIVKTFAGRTPILGICLGHQIIGQSFGAKIVNAPFPVHGKRTAVKFSRELCEHEPLSGVLMAGRYHSLVIDRESIGEELEIIAETDDAERLVMGIQHKRFPIIGVQFHPDSFLTDRGTEVIESLLRYSVEQGSQLRSD